MKTVSFTPIKPLRFAPIYHTKVWPGTTNSHVQDNKKRYSKSIFLADRSLFWQYYISIYIEFIWNHDLSFITIFDIFKKCFSGQFLDPILSKRVKIIVKYSRVSIIAIFNSHETIEGYLAWISLSLNFLRRELGMLPPQFSSIFHGFSW